MLDEYSVELGVRVRFCDTDMLGHVNNAVYLMYFEAGRMEYWIELTGNPSLENLPFILARAEVDFLAEARAGEHLTLGIRAGRLGTKSFELEYELFRDPDREAVARGKSVQVMFDYRAKETLPMSDEVRESIIAFETERGGLRFREGGGFVAPSADR